ncbi:NEDD4-binding protein 2 [Bienertia sinuspersici]
MAAAGNDFDTASSFLKAMVSEQSSQEHKYDEVTNNHDGSLEWVGDGKLMNDKKDGSLKETLGSALHSNNNENVADELTLSAENLFDNCMEINAMLDKLTFVPVEPEWEEDDVYLSCRKDAIKMMRTATRHSKAASNSFLRGDHISAQQFSLKAREEWKAAQNLNAKAANEIISIRNENNGIWKLDLHGLHASEAVQAVKERLYLIETQVLSEGSRPQELPNSLRTKAEAMHASYQASCYNSDKSNGWASDKLKPMWLEVITGIGNHSRGGASLPSAVRSFFADNGYRFDEVRPGVIMVRPKFRPN